MERWILHHRGRNCYAVTRSCFHAVPPQLPPRLTKSACANPSAREVTIEASTRATTVVKLPWGLEANPHPSAKSYPQPLRRERGLPSCFNNSIGAGGFAAHVCAPKFYATGTSRAEPEVFNRPHASPAWTRSPSSLMQSTQPGSRIWGHRPDSLPPFPAYNYADDTRDVGSRLSLVGIHAPISQDRQT
jgi:hypothetical protein